MKHLLSLLLCIAVCLTSQAKNGIYNAADFGIKADTTFNSAKAIQKAIDTCAKNGGGTVIVPAGDYLCSTIWLDDNVTLYLSNGCTLYASRNMADYEGASLQRGAGDMPTAQLLIGAIGKKNIGVEGRGTIHCRAHRYSYQRDPVTDDHDNDRVTGREVRNAHNYGVDYRTKWRKTAPYTSAIYLVDCENVQLRDARVIEANGWSVHIQWCKQVTCDNLYIYSDPHNGVNADGLDIDGSENVRISNCEIRTGDDALCLKTTRLNGRTEQCRWITVNNCILQSSSAALKLGTESHADFRDIVVSNCVIDHANRGLNMIIRDGGSVQNVLFNNLTIYCNRHETFWWGNGDPLWFTTQKRDGEYSGNISNVVVSNVIAYGQSGVRLEGFDSRIKNITIKDFQLFMEPEDAIDKRSANGYLFDGVDGLTLDNCSVTWNEEKPESVWESAFYFKDVNDLKTQNISAPKAPNGKYDAIRYGKKIEVLVHRGANALAPENTMPSADSALVHGATWIEVDVRTTKDGVMFNLHDDELERTTDGKGKLTEKTAKYIETLDCGSWFGEQYKGLKVPTIQAMLDGLKGRANVFFDVKNCNIKDLVDLVRESGFAENSFFWFAKEEMLKEFIKFAPEMKIKVNANDIPRLRYWMTICEPSVVETHVDAITTEFLVFCHDNNIKVMVAAQGENEEDYQKAIECGADMINLDKPELFEKLLK